MTVANKYELICQWCCM